MSRTAMFDHAEDRAFFEELLEEVGGLADWQHLFDLRDPELKRREFNRSRYRIHEALLSTDGERCQLRCHGDCSGAPDEVDHLVPLKMNVLNKSLRAMRGHAGRKVPPLSYGSNDLANLVLACKRCNAFKKHRLPTKEVVERILPGRNLKMYQSNCD